MNVRWNCLIALLAAIPFLTIPRVNAQTTVPVVVATNTTIRVVAANLSSGNNQRYETPGLNILKGLKPDVVAIQEFNYKSATFGTNTAAAFREMIDNTLGTNFTYFREGAALNDIPNGVISRYPILASGEWDDVELSDREFVWAKLDVPGTNELYVVSVHLKASGSDSAIRARQAQALKSLIQSNFPANAFVVLAGDMNIGSSGESCLTTFKTFLSDSPIPTDGFSNSSTNMNTNLNRSERYDYVFPSFSLDTNRVATVIGSKSFSNGLVFDSRVYSPLADVSPVTSGDSGVSGMQHMAVVKDFRISYTITNYVTVTPPTLSLISTNIVRWRGQTNVTYTVQSSTNLTNWASAATVSSTSTNFGYTNLNSTAPRRFYRVTYP